MGNCPFGCFGRQKPAPILGPSSVAGASLKASLEKRPSCIYIGHGKVAEVDIENEDFPESIGVVLVSPTGLDHSNTGIDPKATMQYLGDDPHIGFVVV
eukprot:GHVO01068146.1.p1 GENE.GHVO01068146.1~~GHVO01068146.1.p1  ORF type:complete len:108 (+),score=2.34 GHVO01068146.1:31-324(+)